MLPTLRFFNFEAWAWDLMPEILSLMQMKGYSNFITYDLSGTAKTNGIPADVKPSCPQKCVDCTVFRL
jgi:hypothetical protein